MNRVEEQRTQATLVNVTTNVTDSSLYNCIFFFFYIAVSGIPKDTFVFVVTGPVMGQIKDYLILIRSKNSQADFMRNST